MIRISGDLHSAVARGKTADGSAEGHYIISSPDANCIFSDFGIRRIAGPDLGGEVQIGPTDWDTPVNLKVELDMTNPANYQATWFIDGVQQDFTFIGAPALTHVFINKHDGSTSGTVDNFLLVDNINIPEPASLAMALIGLGLVVGRRPRRQ